MKSVILGLVALLIVACASIEAKTPAQRVYALQADYNALLSVAVAYESQPRCAAGAPVLSGCSDTKVVSEIRLADNDAYALLRAAQDTVRTPGVQESTVELALTIANNAIIGFRKVLANRGVLR